MNTQKVAISIPTDLMTTIDGLVKKRGISRSKYIASILLEKVETDRYMTLKEAYDRIYSDEAIRREQLGMAHFFEGTDNGEGQEW